MAGLNSTYAETLNGGVPASNSVDANGNSTAPATAPIVTAPILPRVTPTPGNLANGLKTDAQGYIIDPTTGISNNPNPPQVPPTTNANGVPSDAESYLGTFSGAPPTEDQTYQDLLNQSSGLISSINASYQDNINSANAASAARVNAGGLAGSSAGGTIYNEAQQPIIDQRNEALAQVYDSIQKNAITLNQQNIQNAQTSAEDVITQTAAVKANATQAIQTMAAAHLDWNNYKATNPTNYEALVNSLGGDPNVADSLFAMSAPAATVTNQYNTPDGSGGTTVNQIVQDPVTGAVRHVTYDLPGTSIPANYTWNKLGANSGFYAPSDFTQNPDASKLIFVASDPTNSQAITVTQNGVTTVNGVPVSNTSPAAVSGEQGVSSAYAQQVINNTATYSGISDPTQSMSNVIANASVGVEGVVAGIIKQEGGSPPGVINNPGNIKFTGAPGQKDSGVKASDGGTYASYNTLADGKSAVAASVQKAADKGQTFQDFITQYKGLNVSPTSTTWDINSGQAPTGDLATQNYVGTTESGSPVNTGITNQAVYQAAQNYAYTGTMPSLGLGGSAQDTKAIRKAVINGAGAIATSMGTTLPKLQEEFAFANNNQTQTTIANANTVINSITDPTNGLLALSSNVPRGDFTLDNAGKLIVKENISDPAAIDFVNKVNSTSDELGKIFGSGAGSDFTIQLAQSLINPNISDTAFKSSMNTIVGSVQNKVNAYLEQAGGGIGGSTNTGSNNSDSNQQVNISGENYKVGDTVTVPGAPAGLTFTAQQDGSLLGSDGNIYQDNSSGSSVTPSNNTVSFLQENGYDPANFQDHHISALNEALG